MPLLESHKPWVLVDASFLGYRAHYVLKNESLEDLHQAVVLQFFEQLRTICADPRVNSNKVAVCFDSKASIRKQDFPEYKSNRAKDRTPEEWERIGEMKRGLRYLRKRVLPDAGFRVFQQAGLESDDLIAMAAQQLDDKTARRAAIIISSDQDLYQCITLNTVHWYNPVQDLYIDQGRFWAKYELDPWEWSKVKAIAGCDGDGVPGVPGVGEKTAIKYLLNRLPRHHKKYALIEDSPELIERNRDLVRLPHTATQPLDLLPPAYNPEGFFNSMATMGLHSQCDGPRRRTWEHFFEGVLREDRQQPRARNKEVR